MYFLTCYLWQYPPCMIRVLKTSDHNTKEKQYFGTNSDMWDRSVGFCHEIALSISIHGVIKGLSLPPESSRVIDGGCGK